MIAHISSSILKEVMREGLNGEPREGRHRLPNGTHSTEQDVRAISVGFQAELAAKLSQPKHGLGWPALGQEKDELSGHQDESKDTAHALHGADTQVFHIQFEVGQAGAPGVLEAARAAELPALTRLVEAALLADLAESIPGLMERVQRLAAVSADIPHLMESLPPLINVTRYGNVRQTDTALVRQVVDELITRVCIGLPAACSALDDAAAGEMFERIKSVNGGMSLLEDSPHTENWLRTLSILAAPGSGHGLTRGLASRFLYDFHADEQTAARMSLALSPGTPAAESAAWVQGFLHSGGQALIHDPGLWRLLDEWVLSLPETLFTSLLPLLRRTFSTFPAPERRQIGELAKTGGRIAATAGKIELDPVRAEKALLLANLILGKE